MAKTKFEKATAIRSHYAKYFSQNSGVYRWWFPEKLLNNIPSSSINGKIEKIFGKVEDAQDETCQDAIEIKNNPFLNRRVQIRKFDEEYYVALYLGKSKNLHRRMSNHFSSSLDNSVLRRTINDIFQLNSNTQAINDIIDSCYVEWIDLCDECCATRVELAELVRPSHYYPFNTENHLCHIRNFILCNCETDCYHSIFSLI